jgi:hypothetical protein
MDRRFIPKPSPDYGDHADPTEVLKAFVERSRPQIDRILEKLLPRVARFDELLYFRCNRDQAWRKVAESIGMFLYRADIAEDAREDQDAATVRRGRLEKAAAILASDPEGPELSGKARNIPTRAEWKRTRDRDAAESADYLVVQLVAILRHTTSNTETLILRKILPGVLTCCTEITGKRGLADAERRFKRIPARHGQSKSRIVDGFRRLRFRWDTRFSSALFERRRSEKVVQPTPRNR